MPRKLPRFLTPLEVAEMFQASDGRDLLLLKCLYFLGLRNSEAQNLLIEDIDIINKTVKVVMGKRKKDRYVPIHGDFAGELKAFIGESEGSEGGIAQDSKSEGSKEGTFTQNIKSEGYLFPGRSQGRLSDRQIRRIVKAAAHRAGVRKAEEVHPHTLRHSYATHLQNSGVPLNIIQNMLGHERLETTAIYSHMGVEKAREWIEHAFSKKSE